MSRPLLPTVEHRLDAADFHKAVFKAHGNTCYFHGNKWWQRRRKTMITADGPIVKIVKRKPHERCQKNATDAMHIVPRGLLGPKSRFACPEENGRPGCRPCHDLQTDGKIDFPDALWNKAVRAILKMSPRLGLREK